MCPQPGVRRRSWPTWLRPPQRGQELPEIANRREKYEKVRRPRSPDKFCRKTCELQLTATAQYRFRYLRESETSSSFCCFRTSVDQCPCCAEIHYVRAAYAGHVNKHTWSSIQYDMGKMKNCVYGVWFQSYGKKVLLG